MKLKLNSNIWTANKSVAQGGLGYIEVAEATVDVEQAQRLTCLTPTKTKFSFVLQANQE